MQHRTKDLFLQFGKVIQFDQRRGDKGEVNPPLRMLNGVQKFFAV
ncbi:hypothetical protein EC970007_1136, partial [Escherichia coli 97.0007]